MTTPSAAMHPIILSTEEARSRGLIPLTVAEPLDAPIQVGHSTEKMRYIEWLTSERQRITRAGDRQAEIVAEGNERVSLWVDDVTSHH